MEIKQIPYFTYKINRWNSHNFRVSLKSSNIESILEKLETGENLFNLLPELEKINSEKIPMVYALFERREEIHLNNKKFLSEEGYVQVGKMLVPEYNIIKREEIKESIKERELSTELFTTYLRLLSNHPDAETFHKEGSFSYTPVEDSNIIILQKDQL